ncbi:MAG: hypothetical protein FWD47_05700 [Treponema sp.]|nr:hypothetical protein [Treponema sp.]
MKKNTFYLLGILCFILPFIVFLNGCEAIPPYMPDLTIAENPRGLSVDPENCAYIGGRIRAIGNHDFDPGKGAMESYPTRTVRVPAGETMIALIHYAHQSQTTVYYGFKFISLPPLESGSSYLLYLDAPSFGTNWKNKQINLKRVNLDSGILENIEGATFIN